MTDVMKPPKDVPKKSGKPRATPQPHYPQPYGTKAMKSKGNLVQPAFQKRNNQKGR